jgi:protein-arginine kinase
MNYKSEATEIPEGAVVLTEGAYKSLSSKAKANVVKAVELRKETAREILQSLSSVIHDNEKYGNNFVVVYTKDLQELAKQFGVEVE